MEGHIKLLGLESRVCVSFTLSEIMEQIDRMIVALASTIMVTLVTWLSCVLNRQLAEALERFQQWLTNKHRLEVKEIDGQWRDTNMYYRSLIWYFSAPERSANAHNLTMARFNRDDTFDVLLPADNSVCTLDARTVTIKYAFKERTHRIGSTEVANRYIELMTRNGSTRDLVEFARAAHSAYNDHKNNSAWTPYVYRIKDKVWVGRSFRNTKTWETVFLEAAQKKALVEDMRAFFDSEQWYEARGVAWTRGYLLDGPPGCGKTSIVKAMANDAKLDIYVVNLLAIRSDAELEACFCALPTKCLVLMEDVDCMSTVTHARDDAALDNVPKPPSTADALFEPITLTLSGLLNVIDGVVSGHGRLLVMTTNHKDKLDGALLRPGRCDVHVTLGYCTRELVADVFKTFTSNDLPAAAYEALGSMAGAVSPAAVVSAMMKHRGDDEGAVRALLALAGLGSWFTGVVLTDEHADPKPDEL